MCFIVTNFDAFNSIIKAKFMQESSIEVARQLGAQSEISEAKDDLASRQKIVSFYE